MANERYNFKYLPLVGKLPGKSMVEQTETAINELASVVYDNVGYVGNLAEEVQTANTNASNALDKATEALETSGRVYIKLIAAVDVNDYYDSELYYINNDGSTNIPVRDRGFLEVKTNDDKTACEQVFIADSTGTPYYRHGRITEQTLGEETTYVVTWGSWYQGATAEYVQAELQDYVTLNNLETELQDYVTLNNLETELQDYVTLNNLETELQDYLPLSGGTMTGAITLNDGGNPLSTAGGTMTGAIKGNPLTLTADDGNGNSADLVINSTGTATLAGNELATTNLVDFAVTSTSVLNANPEINFAKRFGKLCIFSFNASLKNAIGTYSEVAIFSLPFAAVATTECVGRNNNGYALSLQVRGNQVFYRTLNVSTTDTTIRGIVIFYTN